MKMELMSEDIYFIPYYVLFIVKSYKCLRNIVVLLYLSSHTYSIEKEK